MVGKGLENRILRQRFPAYCVAAPRQKAVSCAARMLGNNQLLSHFTVRRKCSWCLTKAGHTGTSSLVCRKLVLREIKFNPNSLKIALWRLGIQSQNNGSVIFRKEKNKPTPTQPWVRGLSSASFIS